MRRLFCIPVPVAGFHLPNASLKLFKHAAAASSAAGPIQQQQRWWHVHWSSLALELSAAVSIAPSSWPWPS